MIRYLIWDAGGTLFDTYPAVVEACRIALNDFGESAPSEQVMQLCKQTTAHSIHTLATTFRLKEEELQAHFKKSYDDIAAEHQPPFPGVEKLCRYICANDGQNFIVTHRARASLQALLEVHNLQHYFSTLITKESPYPRKPDPASMKAILNAHNLPPQQCLAIGDRDLDIQAGRRSGIRTCFFSPPPAHPRADISVNNFADLYRWIVKQNASI